MKVIDGDTALGQQFLNVPVGRRYRRYQRTAIEMTSEVNRKPANTEDEPDDVTKPVPRPTRSTIATVPSEPPGQRSGTTDQRARQATGALIHLYQASS